jgi:hypothetical protein
LTGCFANPLDQLTEGISEGIVEGVVEGATGVDVDVSGDGTSASLPSDWPTEVPTPNGKIIASFSVNNSYSATIDVGDDAAAAAGVEAIAASGFEITSETDLGGFKVYGLENAEWSVNYSWGADEAGATFVNLTVSPKSS